MKKLSLLLSVCTVLLFGTALAGAQKTKTPAAGVTKPSNTMAGSVKTNWDSFRPETLRGTIAMVDAVHNLVVVRSGSVPFDLKVTKATRIEIAGNKRDFKDLTSQTQKEASVVFVARANGDYAKNISVTG